MPRTLSTIRARSVSGELIVVSVPIQQVPSQYQAGFVAVQDKSARDILTSCVGIRWRETESRARFDH
jgi:hypothetical protein